MDLTVEKAITKYLKMNIKWDPTILIVYENEIEFLGNMKHLKEYDWWFLDEVIYDVNYYTQDESNKYETPFIDISIHLIADVDEEDYDYDPYEDCGCCRCCGCSCDDWDDWDD